MNNRVVAASLETRGAVARHDPATGRLHLALSGQGVHGIRHDLAASFAVEPAAIHVTCPDVGGGFGMKNVVHPEYVALLWAARRLGRPVRWIADRTEDFMSGAHGRDNLTSARLALDAAGRFTALHVETIGNLGAYVSALGPGASTNAPSTAMGGVYAIPAVFMDVRGAFTHTVPLDAYRGAGKPEANYLIERLVDVAAHELGRDPAELRRPQPPARLPVSQRARHQHRHRAATTPTCPPRWTPPTAPASPPGARRHGRRASCSARASPASSKPRAASRPRMAASAFLPDGTVELLTGTQSNGQGLATSFAQLAAARLGLPVEAFRLVQADSDRIARGGGHGGARSLPMAGTALWLAIDAALDKARAEAARLLQPTRRSFASRTARSTPTRAARSP